MQSTQLACPHCGSTLNFGIDIAEGTPVECLICMQTFHAANPVPVFAASERSCTLASAQSLAPTDTPPTASESAFSISAGLEESMLGSEAPTVPEAVMKPDSIAPATEMPVLPEVSNLSIDSGNPAGGVKRTPKGEVLIAKPFAAPLASAMTQKTLPKPAAALPRADKTKPSAPATSHGKPAEDQFGAKIVLTVATCGLLILLTGGILFAGWQVVRSTRASSGTDDTQAANNGNDGTSKKPVVAPGTEDEDDEDLRTKIKDEVKKVLERKNPLKPGTGDLDLDPISSLNLNKQPIAGLDQQKINAAIEKGVAYLKRTQNANGTWHHGHGVGHASIGGLTLLECDVPANDPTVQKAAYYVRTNIANLNSTYELSLAILFLDRLGDTRDRPQIQGMALRLLAGQNDCGGWTYSCPALNPKEMFQLYAFLQSNKQPNLLNPIGGGNPKTQSGIVVDPKRDPAKFDDPFQQFSELILTQAIEAGTPDPKKGGVIPPVGSDPMSGVITPVGIDPKTMKPDPKKPAVKPIRPETLTPNLQKLPIVQNQGSKKGQTKLRKGDGDNSNTQFAMLALWAARRHNVPTDQALLASYQRFMNQNADGGWGYHTGSNSTNTMTNVGLLGLAMGHGAAPEIVSFNPKNPRDVVIKPALEDPSIQRGLQALARHIGQPSTDPAKTNFPMQNLYLLWSVERVAMLYDLKTIGGKDWYGWGAQILVHNQSAGGDWPTSHYHGAGPSLNTCFALLFLRRSNLVRDLTNNLRLNTGIVDP